MRVDKKGGEHDPAVDRHGDEKCPIREPSRKPRRINAPARRPRLKRANSFAKRITKSEKANTGRDPPSRPSPSACPRPDGQELTFLRPARARAPNTPMNPASTGARPGADRVSRAPCRGLSSVSRKRRHRRKLSRVTQNAQRHIVPPPNVLAPPGRQRRQKVAAVVLLLHAKRLERASTTRQLSKNS